MSYSAQLATRQSSLLLCFTFFLLSSIVLQPTIAFRHLVQSGRKVAIEERILHNRGQATSINICCKYRRARVESMSQGAILFMLSWGSFQQRKYGESSLCLSSSPSPSPNDNEDEKASDGWSTESDDDGWSDDDAPSSSFEDLKRLQQQVSRSPSRSSISSSSITRNSEEQEERDLFIPIFAVVSLLGLFGSYGYEMFRLASRGELYLPWNQ